jgi:cell wall-associated NlpC family hydrolase
MAIQQYIGIPYAPKGIPPNSADCWTLCRHYAQQELKRDYPEFMYDIDTFLDEAEDHIAEQTTVFLGKVWSAVAVGDHRLGDIALFRVKGHITHCGIILDQDNFLHTLQGRMSCVERLSDWMQRLTGIYRHAG